jgi:circadian clock protein KaiB
VKAGEQMADSDTPPDTTAEYERLLRAGDTAHYVLRLYVTGMTPRSQRAIENLRRTCEEHLKGRYELEVVDVYQHPTLAEGEQIIAAPTLVKVLPLPLRRLVGDLSDQGRVLLGLDLRQRDRTGNDG